ncbi:MAG: MMPL family transporter [Lachnospiraceae bacterium]
MLQLALSLDYAIIFCNRYKEEHQTLPIREAVIVALSKAIPEIEASSLTTVGGLIAMMFMQFKIGSDMAICLIKSIMFALLSVFVVMPGLLMLFGPLMDRTEHRNFVPKIPFVGNSPTRPDLSSLSFCGGHCCGVPSFPEMPLRIWRKFLGNPCAE